MPAERCERYRQLAEVAALIGYHRLFAILGNLVDREEGWIEGRVGQLLARRLLAHFDLPVRVEGLERLEGLERYAVAANHQSYLDWAVLLAYFPVPLRFVAKKELLSLPAIGPFLRRRGIPIDRARGEDARAAIRRAVADGSPWPILIFPEGTRVRERGIRPFRPGGLSILFEAGLPVVPVCLRGTYEALPKDGKVIRRGQPLELRVGEPVDPADFPDTRAAVAEIEARVRALYGDGLPAAG